MRKNSLSVFSYSSIFLILIGVFFKIIYGKINKTCQQVSIIGCARLEVFSSLGNLFLVIGVGLLAFFIIIKVIIDPPRKKYDVTQLYYSDKTTCEACHRLISMDAHYCEFCGHKRKSLKG